MLFVVLPVLSVLGRFDGLTRWTTSTDLSRFGRFEIARSGSRDRDLEVEMSILGREGRSEEMAVKTLFSVFLAKRWYSGYFGYSE